MAQRVRKSHRGRMPFVCHTTPHFDSTSREVSYSVRPYHTRRKMKSKYFFLVFEKIFQKKARKKFLT